MSVELRPLGIQCNITCRYCYQDPQRGAGNVAARYDVEAMKRAVLESGGPFTLFGGEPLLVPLVDLEDLWAWGYAQFARNKVQTNGTLIDDRHIALFKRYNVHIGISVDGPEELNALRWVSSRERTQAATAASHAAIERLCQEGLPPSIIVTLHRFNAGREQLPVMAAWFRRLETLGVRTVRLHMLEAETHQVKATYALTDEENIEALLSLARLERDELTALRFDTFDDMRNLLRGRDHDASCVWHACDPYTTKAVQGIEGFGQRSNCGRTNKDGVDFVWALRC